MHPDLIRELIDQRGNELRSQARQALLVSALRKARRSRRRGGSAEQFAAPRIPDYVDGTFRTDGQPAQEHSTAGSASRHAA
ncbi:MAG: hypothetical protein JOY82_15940 [Streptosporangiaceae bacterium]|nr:hypothetical protein [Streptosporangiaceae bacterium]MBV9855983.1 hypothetical protein [Streptosporangiaceae bacterium]